MPDVSPLWKTIPATHYREELHPSALPYIVRDLLNAGLPHRAQRGGGGRRETRDTASLRKVADLR